MHQSIEFKPLNCSPTYLMAYQNTALDYDDFLFGEKAGRRTPYECFCDGCADRFTELKDEDNFGLFQSSGEDQLYEGTAEWGLPIEDQSPQFPDATMTLYFEPSAVSSYPLPLDDNDSDTCIVSPQRRKNGPHSATCYAPEFKQHSIQNAIRLSGTTSCQTAILQGPDHPSTDAALPAVISIEDLHIEPSRKKGRSCRSPRVQEKKTKQRKARNQSQSPSGDESASQKAKHAHSVVERRYRDNLNGKITQLHRTLIAAETVPRTIGQQFQISFQDLGQLARIRKSDIISKAIQYVHQSEVEIRHMCDEIHQLRERIQGLEMLVKCEDYPLLNNMVALQLQQR